MPEIKEGKDTVKIIMEVPKWIHESYSLCYVNVDIAGPFTVHYKENDEKKKHIVPTKLQLSRINNTSGNNCAVEISNEDAEFLINKMNVAGD